MKPSTIKVNNTFAKRINFVAEQCQRVEEVTHMVLRQKHFPLIISGDHSSALGSLAGIKSAFPDKTIGAIWIDAHADLHSPLELCPQEIFTVCHLQLLWA